METEKLLRIILIVILFALIGFAIVYLLKRLGVI